MKAFIFDLDGVLTDTAEFHYRAWKKLGERIGISFDREFNEQLKGISRMESLERILAYGNKEEEFTEEEKKQLAAEKNEDYKELITQITPEDLLPGIPEFLEEIKENDIRMAIASASRNAPVILERLGIMEEFDAIVDPAQLQRGKPDPEIFLKGAELLGVPPNECVGIEDAEAGIEAINAAGMFSVGVGTPQSMKDADYSVEHTDQLTLAGILEAAREKQYL
ncbi:beta-phosphoglucomutase [Atopococcus tabaci]|uniref:beta-phosphoglucomutase n=1 Tax=Atopococcus tabaci TaxID=269774 RepID=UPI000420C814|nr:beta-phosphoglucomutase [Atopococcus tabaci]